MLKSRGMPHSNQVREFVFTDKGIDLIDVFVADGRVLTGRMRLGAQHGPVAAKGARASRRRRPRRSKRKTKR